MGYSFLASQVLMQSAPLPRKLDNVVHEDEYQNARVAIPPKTIYTYNIYEIYARLYLSVYLSACLPACLPVCLSVNQSITLSIDVGVGGQDRSHLRSFRLGGHDLRHPPGPERYEGLCTPGGVLL